MSNSLIKFLYFLRTRVMTHSNSVMKCYFPRQNNVKTEYCTDKPMIKNINMHTDTVISTERNLQKQYFTLKKYFIKF